MFVATATETMPLSPPSAHLINHMCSVRAT